MAKNVKKRKSNNKLLIAGGLLIAAGYFLYNRVKNIANNLLYSFKHVKLVSVGLTSIKMKLALNVENRNDITLNLDGLYCDVHLGKYENVATINAGALEVPAKKKIVLELPFTVSGPYLVGIIADIIRTNDFAQQVKIDGHIRVGNMKYPFKKTLDLISL